MKSEGKTASSLPVIKWSQIDPQEKNINNEILSIFIPSQRRKQVEGETTKKAIECEKGFKRGSIHKSQVIEFQNLYFGRKYASSKNYYYTKEINDVVDGYRGAQLFKFKDNELFSQLEECLKRFYLLEEYPKKIEMLSDYYR